MIMLQNDKIFALFRKYKLKEPYFQDTDEFQYHGIFFCNGDGEKIVRIAHNNQLVIAKRATTAG